MKLCVGFGLAIFSCILGHGRVTVVYAARSMTSACVGTRRVTRDAYMMKVPIRNASIDVLACSLKKTFYTWDGFF